MKVLSTRFNNTTYLENRNWRKTNNFKGCLYSSPKRISTSIALKEKIYVLEMNNDTNKIMGIGIINNEIYKPTKMYKINNLNRYTYKGNTRISRHTLKKKSITSLELFEKILFYGKTHSKRLQGITKIPISAIKDIDIFTHLEILIN